MKELSLRDYQLDIWPELAIGEPPQIHILLKPRRLKLRDLFVPTIALLLVTYLPLLSQDPNTAKQSVEQALRQPLNQELWWTLSRRILRLQKQNLRRGMYYCAGVVEMRAVKLPCHLTCRGL
jgi:hypothetical protein